MILSDILMQEAPGNPDIHLHREGLFWKAYEYSAYQFIHTVRAYNPQKKWMKGLQRDIVSLGFPDRVLAEILQGRTAEQVDEKNWIIRGTEPVGEEEFENWKEKLSRHVSTTTASCPAASVQSSCAVPAETAHSGERTVLAKLAAFQVESASPLQCMMFISELQKELRS